MEFLPHPLPSKIRDLLIKIRNQNGNIGIKKKSKKRYIFINLFLH